MKHIFFTTLFLLALPYTLVAQIATNVRAHQVGETIVITYNLNKKTNIRVLMATGQSSQYMELHAVTGAVGKNVSSGTNLQIVWQPLKERTEFVAQNVRFKIETYADPIIPKHIKSTWWDGSQFFPHKLYGGLLWSWCYE